MRKGPLEDDLQYIAKYLLQYEQLKETTVMVTGATGLIGVSVVRALIAVEGIHIIALVRNIEKAINYIVDMSWTILSLLLVISHFLLMLIKKLTGSFIVLL